MGSKLGFVNWIILSIHFLIEDSDSDFDRIIKWVTRAKIIYKLRPFQKVLIYPIWMTVTLVMRGYLVKDF
jgi:hypothetical protein